MTVVNLKEFAEKNGLPYDDTGKVDMTKTFQAAVKYAQENDLGTVYVDPGKFLTLPSTERDRLKDIKRRRYQRRYARLKAAGDAPR